MPADRPSTHPTRSVFVSSSFSDLKDFRDILVERINHEGMKAVAVEQVPADSSGAFLNSLLRALRNSGAYVGFIGSRYGVIPEDPDQNPQKLSVSELEFNEAWKLGLPMLVFARDDGSATIQEDLSKVFLLRQFMRRAELLRPDNDHFYLFNRVESLEEFAASATRGVRALRDYVVSNWLESQTDVSPDLGRGSATIGGDDSPDSPRTPESKLVEEQKPSPSTDGKPLVFISASREDGEWLQLLKTALEAYSDEIEVWDNWSTPAGLEWLRDVETAIARAQAAALLISPDYLDSPESTTELPRLLNESTKRLINLVPIVVREPTRQRIAILSTLPLWANRVVLSHLEPADRRDGMNRVAIEILESIGITPRLPAKTIADPRVEPKVDSSAFHFSDEARIVIERARFLADQSRRGRITSSCLLFGFAESATPERDDCALLVRNMIVATGKYESAFQAFLDDANNSLSNEFVKPVGETSRNVKAVLEHARAVAIRVALKTRGSDTIHQRHLLAGLLSPPGRKGQLNAHKRLKDIGIDRPSYLGKLLEFILTSGFEEDLDQWNEILSGARQPTSARKKGTTTKPKIDDTPFVEGPAGYTSEFVGVGGEKPVADHLFVRAHADRLAELISLRETKLPLAIGLFGNWGSGKSHFMNLIDRRLKGLMQVEKDRPANSSPKWCREIVPIYFNAWHYLDANLWASLVAQIFESLFAHLSPRGKDLEEVQAMLEKASGATARAAEELAIAQSATRQAKQELATAKETRIEAETFIDGALRGLESLLSKVTAEKVQQETTKLLGIEKEVKTIDDLRQVAIEADSIRVRALGVFRNLWKQPGRAWRIAWLLTAVAGGALIGAIVVWYLPWLKDRLGSTGRAIGTVLGTISAFGLWLRPLLATASKRLTQIEQWANQAESEQQRKRETPLVQQAAQKLTVATAKEEAARLQLAEAQTRENQLKEEAENLSPGRRLGRYIEQRAQSADYRGQLGLVSLARRDFQELSDLFADAEVLKDRITKLRKSEKPEDKQEAAKIEELSRSIDRIVLFVDDLDRCQPEKIVEILQAVHLLLAFPLFAVVVGVDQRALRQSLRLQFKGLLDAQADGLKPDVNERFATPLDYLEKIFHVPFHLPTMGEEGFAELISKLTEPPKVELPKERADDAPIQTATAPKKSAEEPEAERPPQPPQSVPVTPTAKPAAEEIKSRPALAPEATQRKEANVTNVAHERVAVEMVGSVPLSDWERKALRDYHALIQTPRGAKRLLNTYRLVRAGIPKEEWADFSAGEYRITMLLLAAAAGYPATARAWFQKLRTENPEKVLADQGYTSGDPVGWNQFKNVHKATFTNGRPKLTSENTNKWIKRVESFTF